GLCCTKQAAPGWTLPVERGRGHAPKRKTDRGLCVKELVTVDVQQQRMGRGWWAHVLRGGLRGQLPARRTLRGQDPEGSQACRPAGGATDKVRAGDQSQDGKADRRDDSAIVAVPGGQGDQMNFGFSILDCGQDMTKTSQPAFLWFRSDNRKSAIQNPKWLGL